MERYVVERSDSADFSNAEVVPGPYIDSGTSYLAIDVGYSGDQAAPYYRVKIKSTTSGGAAVATSVPLQPVNQNGEYFLHSCFGFIICCLVSIFPSFQFLSLDIEKKKLTKKLLLLFYFAGNIFAVNGYPTLSTIPCGDIAANPCSDIRSALAVAPPGSTVYVTPGIYNGAGNTNLTYAGKAVTIQSTNGYGITMINCTDPVTGSKTRAFEFKTNEGRDSILSGLTIASGAADTGGCVSITKGSPTIRDSLFLACNSTTGVSRGGAIYSVGNPAPGPLIQNTQFIFNWGVEGGAIFVGGDSKMEIEGCFFEWGICPTATGRGGAVCATLANITVKDTIIRNHIVGFGGGAILAERAFAEVSNLQAYNNTAGNFGGAFLLFGAEMRISGSNISGNRGNIFAGGVIITSAVYDATDTIHNNNWGRVGGGALKVVGGQLKLKNCQVNGNSAGYGAGFDISKQGDLSSLFTSILVEDTEVLDNAVPDKGGGFYLDSFDSATFRNVLFKNNTATKGGGGWCVAPTAALFENSTFEENTAQMGGGLFADKPCIINFDGTVFRKNTAVEAGAGVATGDGVYMNISRSVFEMNGVSECSTSKPPKSGGGLMVGVELFEVNTQCGVQTSTPTHLVMTDTSFVGNVAQLKGGGIILESGTMDMSRVEIEGNQVTGSADGGEGTGGGIAVYERCPVGAACSTAIAKLTNSFIRQNSARTAGGGLHFAGGSKYGALTIAQSNFSSNSVEYETDKANAADGVGGGIFLGRANFTLSDVHLSGNEAYYGGGIFFSSNLNTTAAKLSKLSSANNRAVMGSTAFWLRSASPKADLPLSAFGITNNRDRAVATEVLQAAYATSPPTLVQSADTVESFSVSLLDYYDNVGITELGTCAVIAPAGAAVASEDGFTPLNETVSIRPLGSDVGVTSGGAVFSQLEVTGTIGNSYTLQVDCTPNSLGRSRYLNLTGQSLPPLSFPFKVSPCAPGKEPTTTSSGSICVDCPYNTFNTDGEACLPCPRGALCAGGDQVSSQPNFWRSDLNSTEFYPCRTPEICEAGPLAGDTACVEGHEGPLCAVCEVDWFAFAGKCESCDRSGQAKAMLSLAVIMIVVIVLLLFVRSWEFGAPGTPGVMTKVKILLTHFQILALFRDYDVLWPTATAAGLSWFDTFNIGMSMMAPECFIKGSYSFWSRWIFQMLLPLGAVALCVALYFLADFLLKGRVITPLPSTSGSGQFLVKSDAENEGEMAAPSAAEDGTSATATVIPPPTVEDESKAARRSRRFTEYLSSLKIRCWKNAFWLVTLLYPRSSMTALQMFGTQRLDIGTYLTADYSIQVKPPGEGYTDIYLRYMIPGAIMLFTFAVVIPGLWFYVIWKNRQNLDDPVVAQKYGFLYGSYSRKLPFWETAEVLRKFTFAFIPVFIKPNSIGSVQGTVAQIVALGFLVASVWLRPYAKDDDNNLQITSQIGTCI